MKKLFAFTAIVALGMFALSSCKKKDSSPSYYMKATVGSTSFSGNKAIGSVVSNMLSVTGGNFTATSVNPPDIIIIVANYTGNGTYNIDGTSGNGFTYVPDASSSNPSTSGTIVITGTNPIQGTFSGTLADGTSVTNGSFSAQKLN